MVSTISKPVGGTDAQAGLPPFQPRYALSNGEPLADRRIPAGDDFLSAEELAAITPEMLIARMQALKPLVAKHAAEAERLRRPVDEVWNAIRATGYFYQLVPKAMGGLEFDMDTFISTTLPLAEGDPSTGWVASFCVEHNWMIAHMPVAAQHEIFDGHRYAIAPNTAAPPGKAVKVPGGHRLTGRWKWGTGCMHADWMLLNGMLDQPGDPVTHMFLVPAAEVDVVDTWFMMGMAATGSNDLVVQDVFVPDHRSYEIAPVRSGKGLGGQLYDNPIYSAPMMPLLCSAAAIPAIGAAKRALELCRERIAQHVKMGADGTTIDKPAAQMRLAKADLLVNSAELGLRDAARRNLDLGKLDADEQVPHRIQLRAQIAYAVAQCMESVRLSCEAVGSSVYATANPLQRLLRDMQTMQSHIVYDFDVATELRGRTLVGLPPNSQLV